MLGISLLLLGVGCGQVLPDASTPSSSSTPSQETESSDTAASTAVTFVDMHAHVYPVSEEANADYVDDLVSTAKANGISQIVLGLNARQEPERPPTYSPLHDQWVLDAEERYPGVIIPALNGFDPSDPAC